MGLMMNYFYYSDEIIFVRRAQQGTCVSSIESETVSI